MKPALCPRPLALVLLAFILSCGSDGPTAPVVNGIPMYAVTFDNRLLYFGSNEPGTLLLNLAITGVTTGNRIVSMDFRPSDGQLYGVGTDSRVYRINVANAAATPVGAVFQPSLNGEHFGLAVNPVVDLIRTSSAESDQNLRINPTDGAVSATDVNFSFAIGDPNFGENPALAALAYSNPFSGATSTVLFGIESGNDVLVVLNNPNNGQLSTIGPLGVNTVPCAAFDIDARDGAGWLSLADNGISRLFTVNLTTGAATLVGTIFDGPEVQGLAIVPP